MFNQIKRNFKDWFSKAIVRAIKTVAQSAIGVIGASVVLSDVNWYVVISTSALAGIVSLLTSLAGLPEINDVNEEDIDYVYERSDNNDEPYNI